MSASTNIFTNGAGVAGIPHCLTVHEQLLAYIHYNNILCRQSMIGKIVTVRNASLAVTNGNEIHR